jgi:hypothetical protein
VTPASPRFQSRDFIATLLKRPLLVTGLAGAVLLNESCMSAQDGFPPPAYSAKAIRAKVVDGATGQPLEGVVVVARWVLRRMWGDGPRMHIAETTTNGQGEFMIPGWGPKPRPALMELHDKSPQLLLFKHGYVPVELRNGESKEEFVGRFPNYRNMSATEVNKWMTFEGHPGLGVQEAFWDGLVIRLDLFSGTEERWFELLRTVAGSTVREDARQTPQFFEAIYAERGTFNLVGLSSYRRGEVEGFFDSIKRARE